MALDPEVAKFRIGYLYSSVGVFWLNFGRGVAGMYSSSATPDYELEGDFLQAFADARCDGCLRVPLGYRIPPGLVVGVGAVGAWAVWERAKAKHPAWCAGSSA